MIIIIIIGWKDCLQNGACLVSSGTWIDPYINQSNPNLNAACCICSRRTTCLTISLLVATTTGLFCCWKTTIMLSRISFQFYIRCTGYDTGNRICSHRSFCYRHCSCCISAEFAVVICFSVLILLDWCQKGHWTVKDRVMRWRSYLSGAEVQF